MALVIERNDIVNVKAEAIVNTANSVPEIGTGIDSAIYKACGLNELLKERRKIGIIKEGCSKATSSYNLSSNGVKYIIHTVSPIWKGGNNGEEEVLHSSYRSSLEEAYALKCKSIALPLLATGNLGFPKDKSLQIALNEINSFILKHDIEVILVLFDNTSVKISEKLFGEYTKYIDEHYVEENNKVYYDANRIPCLGFNKYLINGGDVDFDIQNRSHLVTCTSGFRSGFPSHFQGARIDTNNRRRLTEKLEEYTKRNEDSSVSFSEKLKDLIEHKGIKKNPEVYNPIGMDRREFSKLLNGKITHPTKLTVFSIGLSLKLNYKEMEDLLKVAGYAFKGDELFDSTIAFCIENEIYDLSVVNTCLAYYNLKGIGVIE